jgi:purine-binding chemotaxis protein CheW
MKMITPSKQFSTFYVADRLYGIDVSEVQEVAKPLPITLAYTAPPSVSGLINMRGQISTAIGLRALFGHEGESDQSKMSVVCRCEGGLLSLLVDQIGDVIEVADEDFEPVPSTVDAGTRRFLKGIYKTTSSIISIIEVNKINSFLLSGDL